MTAAARLGRLSAATRRNGPSQARERNTGAAGQRSGPTTPLRLPFPPKRRSPHTKESLSRGRAPRPPPRAELSQPRRRQDRPGSQRRPGPERLRASPSSRSRPAGRPPFCAIKEGGLRAPALAPPPPSPAERRGGGTKGEDLPLSLRPPPPRASSPAQPPPAWAAMTQHFPPPPSFLQRNRAPPPPPPPRQSEGASRPPGGAPRPYPGPAHGPPFLPPAKGGPHGRVPRDTQRLPLHNAAGPLSSRRPASPLLPPPHWAEGATGGGRNGVIDGFRALPSPQRPHAAVC
ncbi:wiskott-Aldrich syndrome protein homolog 1-like [Sphaerodactylus townsendi]|uniref:wiskott-Aldrich syndrome protein homolog 1-like n=1 Tax=Sphaerodactylus townsendi TaxID=933632 RepID=UPI00202622DE|nr:wiskott-Aldrich syndrome protein homolog 1-like [Sphaerodactylus townsendi]